MNSLSVIDECELKSMTLFKKQLSSYKEVNDYCVSCLTPLEKKVLKEIINKKNAFFTDISFTEKGKYITFFLPKFEESFIKIKKSYHTYKFTWRKLNGDLVFKEYNHLPFFANLSHNNCIHSKVSDYIGYCNGYGWKIINVEELTHFYDSYERVY